MDAIEPEYRSVNVAGMCHFARLTPMRLKDGPPLNTRSRHKPGLLLSSGFPLYLQRLMNHPLADKAATASELQLTVLVVDDVPVIRLVLTQHVQSLGHRVVQAGSGQEAIDCLRSQDIDLVLLDLQMPDMSGFEVMRWMKDMLRDRWRPVIVISTHDTEAPVLQALECGADDYMSKPVHQRILSAKLRNFSSRVAAQRANATLLRCVEQQREELQERVDREAWVGARIQGVLLMGNLAQAAGGFELAARAEAAKSVNGDFMDVLPMADGSVDIVLGDVMGKGLLAALMGAEVKQQISRTLVEQVAQVAQAGQTLPSLPSPAAIVNSIHRALTPKLIALESFVTLVYLRLNRARQELTVVSCGHLPPVRLHSGQAMRLGNAQLPMGILESEHYLESRHAFLPGDALLMTSDGLIEAQSVSGDFYGQDRLDARGRAAHAFCATPSGLLEAVRSDVAAFCDSPSLLDDLTMMVVTAPVQPPDDPHRLSLRLPRELDALDALRSAVTSFLLSAGQDDVATGRVNLVLVELFTNIVRHSTVRYAHAIVEIRLQLEGQPAPEVAVLLESAGPPFEPPAVQTPAPEPSLQREGGYGLHIVQALTHDLLHTHAHGINQLRCRVPLAQSDDTCCGVRGCNSEH